MMFRKGIMRKDTEMMTGNILDQSQRNKIIKDNQACSSGESADCSARDLEGISPRCRAAAGICAWHQERELQGAVCLEHETTEETTMELCYNLEVKQLCLLMCQVETWFCPHCPENATSEIPWLKPELRILQMPLQNYCDVVKTKERELEELSSPGCRWLRDLMDLTMETVSGIDSFLNSGNEKPLAPAGDCSSQAHRKGGGHREYQEPAFLPTWASSCRPERMDFNKCWLSLGLRLGGERE